MTSRELSSVMDDIKSSKNGNRMMSMIANITMQAARSNRLSAFDRIIFPLLSQNRAFSSLIFLVSVLKIMIMRNPITDWKKLAAADIPILLVEVRDLYT